MSPKKRQRLSTAVSIRVAVLQELRRIAEAHNRKPGEQIAAFVREYKESKRG